MTNEKRPDAKCLRVIGLIVSLLSVVTVGLGIADVILEYSNCSNSSTGCGSLTTARALAWVAVGIWASVPIFVTGVVTLWYSKQHSVAGKGWYGLLCFMSFVVFAPALITISSLELYYMFKDTGVPISSSSQTDQARFAIPLVIASVGFLLWVHLFLLIFYSCWHKKQKEVVGESVKTGLPMTPMRSSGNGPVHYQDQQLFVSSDVDDKADVDRMNAWSAYRFAHNGGFSRPASTPQHATSYYHVGQAPIRCPHFGPASDQCRASGYLMPRRNY